MFRQAIWAVAVTVQITAGEPCGVIVTGAAGVLPGYDGTTDHPLSLVIQADHGVVPMRPQAVPFPVQGGERLLRGFG
jgi:hypothetical protein